MARVTSRALSAEAPAQLQSSAPSVRGGTQTWPSAPRHGGKAMLTRAWPWAPNGVAKQSSGGRRVAPDSPLSAAAALPPVAEADS